MKIDKIFKPLYCIIASFISFIGGVFLSVNWIPVDINILSDVEKREYLIDGSINYSLGTFFKFLSLVFLILLIFSVFYQKKQRG